MKLVVLGWGLCSRVVSEASTRFNVPHHVALQQCGNDLPTNGRQSPGVTFEIMPNSPQQVWRILASSCKGQQIPVVSRQAAPTCQLNQALAQRLAEAAAPVLDALPHQCLIRSARD